MILRIFVMIIVSYSMTLSQSYFPLKIGNTWNYFGYEDEILTSDKLSYSIISDTTFSDSKSYYKFNVRNFFILDQFVRVDSNYIYTRKDGEHPEIKLFDLNSKVVNSPIENDTTSNYLVSIENIELFGTSTIVRKYRFYNLVDIIYAISDKYGIILYQVSEVWRYSWKLNSCVLNDTIYANVADIDEKNEIIQNEINLYQNYPNPFNPMTTISYFIPEVSFVTLIIYDALGREIVILVNEEQSFGNHKIDFHSGELSSGIYFYQLRTKDYIETKKMLLIK